ncbi:MAG: hypothetical protein V9E82_14735 [Candidatus Nanopelagicales bacterium]
MDDYVARLVGLSVLDGTPYAPADLMPSSDGPWALTVTGRTFTAGRYLVAGDVAGAAVMYVSDTAPAVGEVIRIDVRSAA